MCARRNFPVLAAAVIAVMIVVGCGGSKARKNSPFGKAVAGELVQVSGLLSQRGNTPATMLVLEREDGDIVVVRSKTLQAELQSLAGMRVEIDGEMLAPMGDGVPVINAVRYRMLRLPSGEAPVIGTLAVDGRLCILTATDGKRYWIRGDFVGVIRDFDGAKIWVIGALGDAALPDKPEGTIPFWVTGYGVLAE